MGLTGAAYAVVIASGMQWMLTTGWVMKRLRIGMGDLGKALQSGIVLALLTSCSMLGMQRDWWVEALLAAMVGAGSLLYVPTLVAPSWTDPDGTFRAGLGRRLPGPWRKRWNP